MTTKKIEDLPHNEQKLIRLWYRRPSNFRTDNTGNDAFGFYCWLTTNHPDLIPKVEHGDPYQYLAGIILGWENEHPN
jgi:hypothetical protein